jgi:hypothetical protein
MCYKKLRYVVAGMCCWRNEACLTTPAPGVAACSRNTGAGSCARAPPSGLGTRCGPEGAPTCEKRSRVRSQTVYDAGDDAERRRPGGYGDVAAGTRAVADGTPGPLAIFVTLAVTHAIIVDSHVAVWPC